jgi:hypothetical protein
MDALSPNLDSDTELASQSADWINHFLDQSLNTKPPPEPQTILNSPKIRHIPHNEYLEHLIENNRHHLNLSVLNRPPDEYSRLFEEDTSVSIPPGSNYNDSRPIQSFATNDETQDQFTHNTYNPYGKNTMNDPKSFSTMQGIDTNSTLADNPLHSSSSPSKYTRLVRSDPSNVGIPLFSLNDSIRHLSSPSGLHQRPPHSDPIFAHQTHASLRHSGPSSLSSHAPNLNDNSDDEMWNEILPGSRVPQKSAALQPTFFLGSSGILPSFQGTHQRAHQSDPVLTQQKHSSLRHSGPSSLSSHAPNLNDNSDDEIWNEILPGSRVPQKSAALQPTYFLGSSGIIPSFQGTHQRAHQSDPVLTLQPHVSLSNAVRHSLSSTPLNNDVQSHDGSGLTTSATPNSVSQKRRNGNKRSTSDSAQTEELSQYERERLERIKSNQEFLKSLKLDDLPVGKTQVPRAKRKERSQISQLTTEPRDPLPRGAKIGRNNGGFYAEDDFRIPGPRPRSTTSTRPSSIPTPQSNVGLTSVSSMPATSSTQPFQPRSNPQYGPALSWASYMILNSSDPSGQ